MALRDLDRGANDTAAAYGSILHGRPDPVQLNQALNNANPMYPKLDASQKSYQRAWKGLYVFTDENIENRPKGATSPEVDHIWFMQSLNGLYDRTRDHPYRLAERLSVHGLTEDDVLAEEGPAQNVTVQATGKGTTANTGPAPLRGGQYYYLDFPSTNPDKIYTGGCSSMSGVPNKFLCLWTMPYDPKIHRCTPIGLHKALKDYTDPQDTDFGQHEHATKIVRAVLDSSVVALKMLHDRGLIDDAALESCVDVLTGVSNDQTPAGRAAAATAGEEFSKEFASRWLAPLANDVAGGNLFGDDNDLPGNLDVSSETIFAGGSSFLPTSMQALARKPQSSSKRYGGPASIIPQANLDTLGKRIVAAQIRSSEDLCYFANRANSFYTFRIAGKAITSADPGKEFDYISTGIRGQI